MGSDRRPAVTEAAIFPVGFVGLLALYLLRGFYENHRQHTESGRPRGKGGSADTPTDGAVPLFAIVRLGLLMVALCIGAVDLRTTSAVATLGGLAALGAISAVALFPSWAMELLAVRRGRSQLAWIATRFLAPWWSRIDPEHWSGLQAARAALRQTSPSQRTRNYLGRGLGWKRPLRSATQLVGRGLAFAAVGKLAEARTVLGAATRLLPSPGRAGAIRLARGWLIADSGARGDWADVLRRCRDTAASPEDAAIGDIVAAELGIPHGGVSLEPDELLWRPSTWWLRHRAAAARAQQPTEPAPRPSQSGDPHLDALATHAWLITLPPHHRTQAAFSLHTGRWLAARATGGAAIGRRIATLGARTEPAAVFDAVEEGLILDLVELFDRDDDGAYPAGLGASAPAERARERVATERFEAYVAQCEALSGSGTKMSQLNAWLRWGEARTAWERVSRIASRHERTSALQETNGTVCSFAVDRCNEHEEFLLSWDVFRWLESVSVAHDITTDLALFRSNRQVTE